MDEPFIYYDGQFLKTDRVCLSPFNRGFSYGDGVFETLRVYGGRVFRLKSHLNRLYHGLDVLEINRPEETEAIAAAVSGLIAKNSLAEASLKITAFRKGCPGLDTDPDAEACFMVTSGSFDGVRKSRFEKGITAGIVSIRRNSSSPHVYIKSLNYLENLLGRREAVRRDCDEAVFLNHHDFVTEGSISNIFIIKDHVLQTPPLSTGVLDGITREVVLEIVSALDLPCRCRAFKTAELMSADEAFMTNSLMEIMPLIRVDGQAVGTGDPGPVTVDLMRAYREKVDMELLI